MVPPRWLGPARDLPVAADPDGGNWRAGARTAGRSALAAGGMVLLAGPLHLPQSAVLLAPALAVMLAWSVRDATPGAQAVTTALAAPLAGASLSLGTLLAPHPRASLAGFTAVIFAAVYARRWGPRATALGMNGSNAFFMALFFNAAPADLPVLLLAVLVAAACCVGVRVGLVRERPDQALECNQRALDAQVRVVLRRRGRNCPVRGRWHPACGRAWGKRCGTWRTPCAAAALRWGRRTPCSWRVLASGNTPRSWRACTWRCRTGAMVYLCMFLGFYGMRRSWTQCRSVGTARVVTWRAGFVQGPSQLKMA